MICAGTIYRALVVDILTARGDMKTQVDRFCQEYLCQTRDNGISYQEDPQKTRSKPVYPIKNHQDGGVDDKYGLILSPHMDKKDRSKRSFQFREKRGYMQESEHTSLKSSPMNVGFHRTNASNLQMSMDLMSLGESYHEGETMKNYVVEVLADLYGVEDSEKTDKKEMIIR